MEFQLLEEALAVSSERRFLSICSTGRRLNIRKDRLRREDGESIREWMERTRRTLEMLARRDECFSYPSCINCPKGRDMLLDHISKQRPYWDTRHVETALHVLTDFGPDRRLPDICEIGTKLNELLNLQEQLGISLHDSIVQVEGQFACTQTTSCIHCELGRGIFHEMLLDLAENGLEGRYGDFLRGQHQYL